MIPSLPKILVLITIIWVVWVLFRFIDRRNKIKKNSRFDEKLDMYKCTKCGEWSGDNICSNPKCEAKI